MQYLIKVHFIMGDKVGLMPESHPMHFKLIYEVPTGKVLGVQVIGKGAVDKRIDVMFIINGYKKGGKYGTFKFMASRSRRDIIISFTMYFATITSIRKYFSQ
ncbi:MAG: hypothetical protein J6F30_10350 [Cellulosilyticum sp.]|nr:hypothetical protein [Cellulosilyticum sp.]